LREATDDLEIALDQRHRASYEVLYHAGLGYRYSKNENASESAGGPVRAWRPRHVPKLADAKK
jgi:hypothetical protein